MQSLQSCLGHYYTSITWTMSENLCYRNETILILHICLFLINRNIVRQFFVVAITTKILFVKGRLKLEVFVFAKVFWNFTEKLNGVCQAKDN